MGEKWIIRRTSTVDGSSMYYIGSSRGVYLFAFEQGRATRFDSRNDAVDTASVERGWTVVRLVRRNPS